MSLIVRIGLVLVVVIATARMALTQPGSTATAPAESKDSKATVIKQADVKPTDTIIASTKPITNSIGMKLVLVPAGEFQMGNHESADALAKAFPQYDRERIDKLTDELPLHKVCITKPMYLGTHEVTIAQFKKFVADAKYKTDAERDGTGGWGYNPQKSDFEGRNPIYSWQNPGFKQEDSHPVVNVTWHDANAFCKWLSEKEKQTYRLPTEAEWEYACRAGTTTRFNSGDDAEALTKAGAMYDSNTAKLFPQWQSYAVKSSDGYDFTAPVGSFTSNKFGLYDMHGNVWEWCSDWYGEDYYGKSPTDDPQGPDAGKVRIRRGGSWHTWPLYARAAFRNYNSPQTRYVLVGFRVVREVK